MKNTIRHQKHPRRRREIRKTYIFAAASVVFLVILLFSSLVFSQTPENEPLTITLPEPPQEMSKPSPSPIQPETYTILLDSGHSQENTGAQGLISEEDITEKTTEYLRLLLSADERFNVVLTHEYAIDASIAQRQQTAIDNNADFLISIHCNSNAQSNSISGFEVYAQLPENKNHDASYAVAKFIANELIANGHTPRKATGIFYCRYEEGENGETVQYTLTEQEEANYDFTGDTYGIIKSDLYPAVLIEQGYVASEQDVNNWMSDAGCKMAAQIYYEAICNYFEEEVSFV